MKQIVVTKEVRDFLQRTFSVNRTTIWRALNFRGESELYPKIRKLALDKGGKLVGGNELETTFPVGKMVQTYGSRLRIEYLFDDGMTIVYLDGEKKEQHADLRIPEYEKLQQRLIRLVDTQ